MNVQVAVLCDAAPDDNGKMNLLGAFDTIYAQQLPAVHPQCAVALRVTFAAEDEGQHKLKLNFINADGRIIMPAMEIPITVTLPDAVLVLSSADVVMVAPEIAVTAPPVAVRLRLPPLVRTGSLIVTEAPLMVTMPLA